MRAPVRVGAYCRISIDPNSLRIGVERQREDLPALAAERWPGCAVAECIDNDISAADPTHTGGAGRRCEVVDAEARRDAGSRGDGARSPPRVNAEEGAGRP